MMKIGIIGVGAFSVSLAFCLASKTDNTIVMWSENESLVEEYKKTAKISTLFQDKMFPKSIALTTSYEEALKDVELVFLVTGVAYLRQVCESIKEILPKQVPICIGTKGISSHAPKFVHEVVQSVLKNPVAVLGGPTFAEDVMRLEPVGFVLASKSKKTIQIIQKAFSCSPISIEGTTDLVGVTLCGCVKNIYALGSGIIKGLGYQESTLLLYLTEVYTELEFLFYKYGASITTYHSFAGFGDLVLTCTSNKSRNYTFGELLGKKVTKKEKTNYLKENTVEGVTTLEVLFPLMKKKRIKAPILETIQKIVFENEKPEVLVDLLLKKGN